MKKLIFILLLIVLINNVNAVDYNSGGALYPEAWQKEEAQREKDREMLRQAKEYGESHPIDYSAGSDLFDKQEIPKCNIPKAGSDESIWNVTGFLVVTIGSILVLIIIFAPGPISSGAYLIFCIFSAICILPALNWFPYDDLKDNDFIAMKNVEWDENNTIILSFDYDYNNIKKYEEIIDENTPNIEPETRLDCVLKDGVLYYTGHPITRCWLPRWLYTPEAATLPFLFLGVFWLLFYLLVTTIFRWVITGLSGI